MSAPILMVLGTLMLLEPQERALVAGLVVNRFRGDLNLFADGVAILEQRGGVPVLGVVPWIDDLGLAQEDAVALERGPKADGGGLRIAVVQLPAIANFDDFDPLAQEPGVTVQYIDRPDQLAGAAAAILPGTKHTLAARRWLRERGFDAALQSFPGPLVEICGGYQLLGERVSDPLGVEGAGGAEPGLGLLPVETTFSAEKRALRIAATAAVPWAQGLPIEGYEIHMGRTRLRAEERPVAVIMRRGREQSDERDGYITPDGRIWGCYLHGLFTSAPFRRAWLRTLGWQPPGELTGADPYDRLADTVEAALDGSRLAALLDTAATPAAGPA